MCLLTHRRSTLAFQVGWDDLGLSHELARKWDREEMEVVMRLDSPGEGRFSVEDECENRD